MSSDTISTVTDLVRTALAILTWVAARKAAALRNEASMGKAQAIPPEEGRNAAAESERNIARPRVS